MDDNAVHVAVVGSRDYPYQKAVADVMNAFRKQVSGKIVVHSGGASGPDTWARDWAVAQPDVGFVEHPADWAKWGRQLAGMMRNTEMSELVSVCIAFWDGKSHGTKDMITKCMLSNCDVYILDTQVKMRRQL